MSKIGNLLHLIFRPKYAKSLAYQLGREALGLGAYNLRDLRAFIRLGRIADRYGMSEYDVERAGESVERERRLRSEHC